MPSAATLTGFAHRRGGMRWLPMSLCSATPNEYMGETVTITSNILNCQVLVAKVYTTTTSYIGGCSTEDNGGTGIMLGIMSAPVGSPAAIAVAIGPAFCDAEFTPM